MQPSSCTWNLYPSLQMQHVRPGSSISSSICFSSVVLVTTWPFSFVCGDTQESGQNISTCPPPLPGDVQNRVFFHIHHKESLLGVIEEGSKTQTPLPGSTEVWEPWQGTVCHQKRLLYSVPATPNLSCPGPLLDPLPVGVLVC